MTHTLMQLIRAKLAAFGRKEDGAAIVEYGIALLVVVVIGVTVFGQIGGELNDIFGEVKTELEERDDDADG